MVDLGDLADLYVGYVVVCFVVFRFSFSVPSSSVFGFSELELQQRAHLRCGSCLGAAVAAMAPRVGF